MRYLLIPGDALDLAKNTLDLIPGDRPLTEPQRAALSDALTRCVHYAGLLVAYAVGLGGRPRTN